METAELLDNCIVKDEHIQVIYLRPDIESEPLEDIKNLPPIDKPIDRGTMFVFIRLCLPIIGQEELYELDCQSMRPYTKETHDNEMKTASDWLKRKITKLFTNKEYDIGVGREREKYTIDATRLNEVVIKVKPNK